ncbi:expressed unknown protein [Seminavis robusta]|uniref:Uncharacterized protein n=1 Tax=Seminavis robusta TaxID=568900 RepID=A0A9N8EZY3_9STRA|nr:expressed unknown protein [Seminavis robusta]|eukprot:Sro2374_g325310.1 n/a (211) ;mRNA; r:4705-5337
MAIIKTTPSTSSLLHRNQYQIRAQFLNSLGIVRDVVPTDDDSEDEMEGTNDNGKQPLEFMREDDDHDMQQQTQVTFALDVSLHEIPSHRDYSPEDKLAIWNGSKQVSAIVQRNTVEYAAEGWCVEGVLEEDSFVQLPSGELVHPATLEQQQRIAKQRKLRMQAEKRRKQGYAYKSVADCLNFHQKPVKAKRRKQKPSKRTPLRTLSATSE